MVPSWLVVVLLVIVIKAIARTRGEPLRRKQCRACGGIFPTNAKFCGQCGVAFEQRHGKRKRSRHLVIGRAA